MANTLAKIRLTNLRREEVDTVDEVQRTFNDVYRLLRAQQEELAALGSKLKAAASKDSAAPTAEKPKFTHKKESKQ